MKYTFNYTFTPVLGVFFHGSGSGIFGSDPDFRPIPTRKKVGSRSGKKPGSETLFFTPKIGADNALRLFYCVVCDYTFSQLS